MNIKQFRSALAPVAAALLASAPALNAQTSVGDATSLQAAIDNGDTNILLTQNISLTAPIYIGTILSPTLIINGGGNSITSTSQIFFVQSGNVTISNVTLSGNAQGGNGGAGSVTGGGALGAGGAIFVGSSATVTASSVQFSSNSATGGNSGPTNANGFTGGGGMNSGNGGSTNFGGSSGGGGNGGTGGSSTGIVFGVSNGSGGGGGGLLSPGGSGDANAAGNGGGLFGGTGGNAGQPNSTPGGPNSGGGGGYQPLNTNGSNGGTNGGGGGGSISSAGGAGGDYAGGGAGNFGGGSGGFGGGGGAGGVQPGGSGGFGAGGGAAFFNAGNGGVGATNGRDGNSGFPISGGAGAGLGGAVFAQAGGEFIITGNQTFSGNSVTGGTGNGTAAAAGSDIFVMTGAGIILAPGTGNTITVNGSIADDSVASLPGGAYNSGTATGVGIQFGSNSIAGGTVILNHANTYIGGTTIINGTTLKVGDANALGGGFVNVANGTLSVTGTDRLINVAGGYQQGAQGTLVIMVNGTGSTAVADAVHITAPSAADTQLGGRLSADLRGFLAPRGTNNTIVDFTILDTLNGYTNTFANLITTGVPRGFTSQLIYSGDDVILQLMGHTPGFSAQGLTSNQQGILAPINNTLAPGGGGPGFDRLANLLTPYSGSAATLGPVLNQLSPVPFANFTSVTAFNNASFATESRDNYLAGQRSGPLGTFTTGNGQIDSSGLSVNDPSYDPTLSVIHSRMLAWNQGAVVSDLGTSMLGGIDMKEMKSITPSQPWNVFIEGNVILAQGFSQDDVAHFDDNTTSVTIGADYRFSQNFLAGVTASYAHTDVTLDPAGSSATVDSYSPGVYLSYADHGWYANAIGRYSHNAYTQARTISFLGETASSAPEGNEGTANLDGGYDFHCGKLTFGPLAGLQYTHLALDGYRESGSVADLTVGSQDSDSLRSRVGGRVSYDLNACGIKMTPHADASWQHEFMDQSRGINGAFNNATGSFFVRTPEASRDSALLDVGLDAHINATWTVYGDYSAQAGQDNYFGQSVQAGLRVNF